MTEQSTPGKLLARLRKERRMTQIQLAEQLHVSPRLSANGSGTLATLTSV